MLRIIQPPVSTANKLTTSGSVILVLCWMRHLFRTKQKNGENETKLHISPFLIDNLLKNCSYESWNLDWPLILLITSQHVDSKYNWSVKISTVTAIIHLKGLLIRKVLAARPICKKVRKISSVFIHFYPNHFKIFVQSYFSILG